MEPATPEEAFRVVGPLLASSLATGATQAPLPPQQHQQRAPPPPPSPASTSTNPFTAFQQQIAAQFSAATSAAGVGAAPPPAPLPDDPQQQGITGGQASLFLARDLLTDGREIVVKRSLCGTRDRVEQAELEISILRKCNHPNIVKFHSGFSRPLEGGGGGREVTLAMEMCAGGNLLTYSQSRLASGKRLTELEIVQLFVQACRAVEHLHMQNPPVAHRDIKLENLLLGGDDRKTVKLCDLGSATTRRSRASTKEERAALEADVERFTTPAYRAPELVDLYARKLVSEQVDVWSLGCVLYALAYNSHAFSENLAILNGKFTLPETPFFSAEFKALFGWMFDVEPTTRPRIGDVVDELDELLGNRIKVFARDRGSGRGERSFYKIMAKHERPAGTGAGAAAAAAATAPVAAAPTATNPFDDAVLMGGAATAAAASGAGPPTPLASPTSASTASSSRASPTAANASAAPSGSLRGAAFVDAGGGGRAPPSTSTSSAVAARMAKRGAAASGAASLLPSVAAPTLVAPPAAAPSLPDSLFSATATAAAGSGMGAGTASPRKKSTNPFDDLPPSADPTFFSTPGMSSSNAAGFPDGEDFALKHVPSAHVFTSDVWASSHTLAGMGATPSSVSMSLASPRAGAGTGALAPGPDAGAMSHSASFAVAFFSEPPSSYGGGGAKPQSGAAPSS